MKEEWRDIKDYKGVYQVSNFGRVRSLDRIDSAGRKLSGRMLKSWNNNRGYLLVTFSINGKHKNLVVHQLVAQAFIPNTDNKPEVNHIDEDKTNNQVDNLEWLTRKENNNYGTRNKKSAKSNSKPIKVIYRDNTFEYWESATMFAREFGIGQGYVSNVLRGRYKTAYGMRFEYAEGG